MRKTIFTGAFCAVLFSLAPTAKATPIPTDILIGASLDFNMAFDGMAGLSTLNNASHTGTLNLTSGGVLSQTSLTDLMATGDDPLMGALTDTGDGIRLQSSTSTEGGDFSIETLGQIDFENTSGTDQYLITVDIDIRSSATAQGDDIFAEVELDLGTLMNITAFASLEIVSDTIAGNSRFLNVDGNTLVDDSVGSGGLVELFQATSLSFILDPGETLDLAAFWNWSSNFQNLTASTALDIALRIGDIRNLTNPDDPSDIPAPAPLSLLLLGLSIVFVARRVSA